MQRFTFSRQPELTDVVFQYELYANTGVFPGFTEDNFIEVYQYYKLASFKDEAQAVLETGLHFHPRASKLHAHMAMHCIEDQKEELALEILEEAAYCGYCQIEITILRAKALAGNKRYEEAQLAIAELKKNRELSDIQINKVLLAEAEIAETTEDFSTAFRALETILMAQPNHEMALQKMYALVELSRDYDTSLQFHLKLVEADPYSYLAWFNLGHAYYGKHEYTKAIDSFEYSFLIKPDFVLAYMDCADVCQQIKRYRQALVCYRDILEHVSPNASLMQQIANCYDGLERNEEAKKFYFRALTFHAKNEEVFYRIGKCYLKEYNLQMAARFFMKAWTLDNTREDFLEALATTYFRAGKHSKVYPLMQRVITMTPEEPHAWVLYAKFLILTGRFKEALKLIQNSQAHTWSNKLMLCKAAALYLLNEKHEAFENLGDALEEGESNLELFFELVPHVRHEEKMQSLMRYYCI